MWEAGATLSPRAKHYLGLVTTVFPTKRGRPGRWTDVATAPHTWPEALRLAGALVMAALGTALGVMAPAAVTPGSSEAVGLVWRAGAFVGVVACLLVVASALSHLSGRNGRPLTMPGVVVGWASIIGLVLGGFYAVLTNVPAGDAVGVSFMTAVPGAAAVVLAFMGRGGRGGGGGGGDEAGQSPDPDKPTVP